MGLSLAYPAALWGLIGLPVILGIHFLQSRNRQEEVSSLFLLELLPEETRSGAIFSYIRNGLQLWMQLLAVLLFTVLLARPMWLREGSIQSIAVVVDSSVSMKAFERERDIELRRIVDELEGSAGKTEWWLSPSDASYPSILRAGAKEDVLSSLENLSHWSGPHSPRGSLLRARQLVGADGLVIYMSDHRMEMLPAGAVAVSVGTPIENSGFTGCEVDEKSWKASVVHFGQTPVNRTLVVSVDGISHEERSIVLQPGEVKILSGDLPEDFERGLLKFLPDSYGVDDRMPFVKPLRKPLTYSVDLKNPVHQAWAEKVTQLVPESTKGVPGTLAWKEGVSLAIDPESPSEIWWLNGKDLGPFALVASPGEGLAKDLSWAGFLALPFKGFQLSPSDKVELWMGEIPLVIRRENPSGTRLLLNFDIDQSNAMRFPSMLLLLHRFILEQQAKQALPFSAPLETRQRLPDEVPSGDNVTGSLESITGEVKSYPPEGNAPDQVGYYTVKRGEEVMFQAGVFVGDVSEGNFTNAKPQSFPQSVALTQRKRNSQTDFLMPLWFSLLIGALMLAWWSERSS